jgi:hypothetical protein
MDDNTKVLLRRWQALRDGAGLRQVSARIRVFWILGSRFAWLPCLASSTAGPPSLLLSQERLPGGSSLRRTRFETVCASGHSSSVTSIGVGSMKTYLVATREV